MKRTVLIAAAIFLAACGRDDVAVLNPIKKEAPVTRVGWLPPEEGPADTVMTSTAADPLAAKGRLVFEKNCITCHGTSGRGDGPAAAGLNPKPANFTTKSYMASLTDAHLAKTIKEGGAAVGRSPLMIANPQLSDADVKAIISYLRTLAK